MLWLNTAYYGNRSHTWYSPLTHSINFIRVLWESCNTYVGYDIASLYIPSTFFAKNDCKFWVEFEGDIGFRAMSFVSFKVQFF